VAVTGFGIGDGASSYFIGLYRFRARRGPGTGRRQEGINQEKQASETPRVAAAGIELAVRHRKWDLAGCGVVKSLKAGRLAGLSGTNSRDLNVSFE
jgi:hypothetical protein